MFIAILQHTPIWAWAVLGTLIALGLSQARSRSVTLRRTTVIPVLMVGLSLSGVVGAFGAHAPALLAWALGICGALALLHGRIDTRRVAYDPVARRFAVPGSVWPLVLMLSIFMLKFGVAVTLAQQPALHQSVGLALVASGAYGLFSGIFLGRAMALWTLARRMPSVARSVKPRSSPDRIGRAGSTR